MTPTRHLVTSALIAVLTVNTGAAEAQRSKTKTKEASPTAATVASATVASEPVSPTKSITYAQNEVVHLKLKVRYTSLIVLPKDEVILDFVCGDKELWVIEGEQNLAYVKPAKEGAETNLNLVTASGNLYSFVLNEVSGTKDAPDLKVFVTLRDSAMADATQSGRRFVSTKELDACQAETQSSRAETRQVKQEKDEAIDRGIAQFVTNMRFAYRFESGRKPFGVRAMYYDADRAITYIQARAEETPTLMEIRDGKPNLVNFTYRNGVYVVDKILDSGYLAIGKAKLPFTREE